MTISHKLQAASCDKLSQGQCVMLTAKLTQGAWQKASSFKLQAASICHIFFHAGYAIIHIVKKVLIPGHLTLLWLTPERVFGKWLGIGIPIEQCARTWRGDILHYLTWEWEAPGYHPPSLFFKYFSFTSCDILTQDILTHGNKPQATSWIIF